MLRDLLTVQRAWSAKTFGPGRRTLGIIDHIEAEIVEIKKDPTDVEEWIDIVILALDGAWRTGASPARIVEVLVDKMARNRARKWPDWRDFTEDQRIEHKK